MGQGGVTVAVGVGAAVIMAVEVAGVRAVVVVGGRNSTPSG